MSRTSETCIEKPLKIPLNSPIAKKSKFHPQRRMRDERDSRASPAEPSTAERSSYYYGLPSAPMLVARSSVTPWTVKCCAESWPIRKSLSPASPNHPIARLWDSGLRSDIIKCLSGISWNAIDILRLGYDQAETPGEKPEQVHTLLISVAADSTPWNQAFAAAMACKEVLGQYEVHDVACEVKESELSTAADAAPRTAPKLLSQSAALCEHPYLYERAVVSELLGSSIASLDSSNHEGSKGLYLRRKFDDKILALTCRHVVFQGMMHDDDDYRHSDEHPIQVIQPGSKTMNDLISNVRDDLDENRTVLAAEEEMYGINCEKKTARHQERADLVQELLARESLLRNYTTSKSNIIGHVLFAPKPTSEPAPSNQNRLRDWALVELHPGKHTTPLGELRNYVPLSKIDKNRLRQVVRKETPLAGVQFPLALSGREAVELNGIVPESQIKHPRTTDADDEPKMVVAKFGRNGFTIGLSNSIKSVTRRVFSQKHKEKGGEGEMEEISEEWCIVGTKERGISIDRVAFSAGGDSGACVWDASGRVAGMIGAGTGRGKGAIHDVTYATPIEWLLKDIEDTLGYEVEMV